MTKVELRPANKLIKRFCQASYTQVYAGKEERLRVCRPTIVALLDVTANLRSCGPSWSWQFPAERLLGTLSRLIRSRRFPYAALTAAVSYKYSAELVTSFSEARVRAAWAAARGKRIRSEKQDPVGTFSLSKEGRPTGEELSRMQAVLALEGASKVPEIMYAKKYFPPNGGTTSPSEKAAHRRRDRLVRVRSHVRQAGWRGQGEVLTPTNLYGVEHHFAVVLIDDASMSFAYIESVKASADRDRVSGLPEKRRGTEFF